MSFRIDLHIHSKFSGDNYTEPEDSLLYAINSGLHAVAFTEHYSYNASEFAEGLREKYKDKIMVFRGVEFSALEGHCLVFGVNTDSLDMKHASIKDLIRVVNEKGGVIIPTHPFRGANSIGEELRDLDGLCAIEGYNGYSHSSQNQNAVNLAKEMELPYTGGSDAHQPEDVGSCYTEFSDEVTYDNFIDLIKKGNYKGVDTRKISKAWPF